MLVTFASVIATPAPIAAEPPVAEPSAFDAAAAVSDDVTVSAPPTDDRAAARRWPWPRRSTIVTATAAATDTGPPEVDADGVVAALEPEPPFADGGAAGVRALTRNLTVHRHRTEPSWTCPSPTPSLSRSSTSCPLP